MLRDNDINENLSGGGKTSLVKNTEWRALKKQAKMDG